MTNIKLHFVMFSLLVFGIKWHIFKYTVAAISCTAAIDACTLNCTESSR